MKQIVLILLLSLFVSCSLFKDEPNPGDPDFVNYTYFKTGRFTAPADFSAPLVELYDGYSQHLKINPGDRIRIRYFDSNIQSLEQELIVGSDVSTLGSVLSRFSSFIAQSGTTVTFEMDTVKAGYILAKRTSGPIVYNLNIENMSHPISDTLMHKVFWWRDEIMGTVNRSLGACRSYATSSSRLIHLSDSSGGSLGLEIGDTLFVKGAMSGLSIVSEGRYLPVNDASLTLGSVMGFMYSAARSVRPEGVDFQFGTFSRPLLSGSILMRVQDYDSTQDSLIVYSYNANKNIISPANFNANILFERISTEDGWVIDTNGIVIDSLGDDDAFGTALYKSD